MGDAKVIKNLTIGKTNSPLMMFAANIDTDTDITRWGVKHERLIS
jgi:hypothetical protein